MAVVKYELDSNSSDDNVISVVRKLIANAVNYIDNKMDVDVSGQQVYSQLRASVEGVDPVLSDTWTTAIGEVSRVYVMEKRESENTGVFKSATDRNDTEALRTLSTLMVVWQKIAKNRSAGGMLTADVKATRRGFSRGLDLATQELCEELDARNDNGDSLWNLQTTVDVLNARHDSEGWGFVAQAVETELIRRGVIGDFFSET